MSYDALADMLESIGHFVSRLRIYTEKSHPTPAVDEIVVKLMVELISALVLVTQKFKKRRLRESFLADAITYSARRSRSQTGKAFAEFLTLKVTLNIGRCSQSAVD